MIGAWLFGRIAAGRGVDDRAINSVVLWSLIGAIVGARFFYVLAHWSEFSPKPIESVYIWKGGISLLGGIAGATIANAINIRRVRPSVLPGGRRASPLRSPWGSRSGGSAI